jgi:hypothetical protein
MRGSAALTGDTLYRLVQGRTYHDRSRKLRGYARALWTGPRGREALVRAGLPVALIKRCAGADALFVTRANHLVALVAP